MQIIKVLSLTLILAISPIALAGQWRGVLSRAGFFGRVALGASYEFTPQHATDFLLGVYYMGDERYVQSNFAYRYSRWNIQLDEDIWRPLQFGVFAVHATGNDKYFFRSPDVYPEANYYDATSIRYGVEIGSSYTWYPNGFGLSYHLRIFDTGVIALFNNSNRDLQYYISSGLSLHYIF